MTRMPSSSPRPPPETGGDPPPIPPSGRNHATRAPRRPGAATAPPAAGAPPRTGGDPAADPAFRPEPRHLGAAAAEVVDRHQSGDAPADHDDGLSRQRASSMRTSDAAPMLRLNWMSPKLGSPWSVEMPR